MRRRLAPLLLAILITSPVATADAAKITPPPGPAWRVSSKGDGGKISLDPGATIEHAEITITGTTALTGDAEWANVVAVLKALGFADGYSQVLRWPHGPLTCASTVFCDSAGGMAILIGESDRTMLLNALGRNGMLPPFDASSPDAAINLQSKVELWSLAVDAALFAAGFLVDSWDLPISQQLLVNIAMSIWPDAIAFGERILAGDGRGTVSAARHLYDVTADAIVDVITRNAAGSLAEAALTNILRRFAKLALVEARFILAAAAFGSTMGRAVLHFDDVTKYQIKEGVGGV